MKMKITTMVILLIVFLPAFAFSGEIYGCIKEGKKFIEKGSKVEITTDKNTYSTETDKYGSFRLYVNDNGMCIFKVYYKGQPTQDFAVYTYENPVKYDLILGKRDDRYYLKRK